MTVFASTGNARTFNYQAGDVGYGLFAMAHYVQNLGNEPLGYPEMFRSPRFAESRSTNGWRSAARTGASPPKFKPPDSERPPSGLLERIPVMFEHSRHGTGNSCILWG
jgi:hypothetical protein